MNRKLIFLHVFGENELFGGKFCIFSITDFVYSENNKRLYVLT